MRLTTNDREGVRQCGGTGSRLVWLPDVDQPHGGRSEGQPDFGIEYFTGTRRKSLGTDCVASVVRFLASKKRD